MTAPLFVNPFDARTDPDRAEIWHRLVEKDSAAFAAGAWSMIDGDFDADAFEGIVAHESTDPDRWTLQYPDLPSYRDAWLKMSETFRATKLPGSMTHLQLIHEITHLHEIELAGDRALAHKKFFGQQPLRDGGLYEVCAQTIYRMRRDRNGQWRIIGFIGYLPWERSNAKGDT